MFNNLSDLFEQYFSPSFSVYDYWNSPQVLSKINRPRKLDDKQKDCSVAGECIVLEVLL